MNELMTTTTRFPRHQDECPHPTSVWHHHRKYGDFESMITCMGCGKTMVDPKESDFIEKLQMFFNELDLRRRLGRKAA